MAVAIGTAVATEVAKPLVTRAIEEAGYLCCYNRYVEDYEEQKSRLLAARGSLQDDVKEARQRNESLIDKEAKNWLNEANDLIIEEDTKTKKKWFFGLCTNCIWQYRQGKKFAKKASKIPTLIERKNNLVRVARPAGPPGMKYHSSSDFKDVALDIVKGCGGLPVAIEAIAKSIKSESLQVWKDTSTALQNFDPMLYDDVDGAMRKAYNCLKLSYDNLKNEKAQELFLLCSLFPEDFEIPVELLSRIAIGLGLFGEVDEYKKARRQVREVKRKLVDSSLLLEDEKEEYVKMHDLVHDVAIKIADKVIQVVRNSKTALKENVRFSYWIDGFPDCFDGSKLEILIIFITSSVEFPDSLFESMTKLRVLVIDCDGWEIRGSLWLKSVQSLVNIRTLRLAYLKLEDISSMGNLQNLETLELFRCPMKLQN